MTSKTQTKKELIHGLKTNCKRGYNLLAETQAELTATQKWIIEYLLPAGDCSFHKRPCDYGELTRFLTDLNISIKVPMLTVMKPYTNKKGKTSMKHYTANGFMVNDLKDDKPVLYPTWTKFNDSTFQTNEGGHFTSFADQTVYTLAPPKVVVEEEEEEVEEEEEEVCPFCGILPPTCDCDGCGEVGCYECVTMIGEDELCHDCAEEVEDEECCHSCGTTCLDHTSNKGRGSEEACPVCKEIRCKHCPCECEAEAPKVIGDLITGKITVAVLTKYCRENKFKGHTKMKKKEDLIAFILKQ